MSGGRIGFDGVGRSCRRGDRDSERDAESRPSREEGSYWLLDGTIWNAPVTAACMSPTKSLEFCTQKPTQ